jgi:hypothetical protein
MEARSIKCTLPGELSGKKPRTYGVGRRCPCGVRLMQYNPDDLCSSCLIEPRPPKEDPMKNAMKTRDAAKLLGLNADGVKALADRGAFSRLRRGGRGVSALYAEDEVIAYAASVREPASDVTVEVNGQQWTPDDPLEAALQEALEPIRERLEERDEDRCPVSGSDDCCGAPEECTYAEPVGPVSFVPGEGFYLDLKSEPVDPEVLALDQVRAALEPLDNEQRIRVTEWAIQRFEIRRNA